MMNRKFTYLVNRRLVLNILYTVYKPYCMFRSNAQITGCLCQPNELKQRPKRMAGTCICYGCSLCSAYRLPKVVFIILSNF